MGVGKLTPGVGPRSPFIIQKQPVKSQQNRKKIDSPDVLMSQTPRFGQKTYFYKPLLKFAGNGPSKYGSPQAVFQTIGEASQFIEAHRQSLGLPGALPSQQNALTPLELSCSTSNLFYKREDLTATHAYKVRGAFFCMTKALAAGYKDFLTVSTGNHALGVLKAAEILHPHQVQIVVPEDTQARKLEKITAQIEKLQGMRIQASLVRHGKNFDEAKQWALTQSKTAPEEYFLDPYNDPWVVAGQGTIGLELYHQLQPILKEQAIQEITVIAPVGGGGLLSGLSTGLSMAVHQDPSLKDLKLHFLGLKLANLNSPLGDAIRVGQIPPENQQLLDHFGAKIQKISDDEIQEGYQGAFQDLKTPVEYASGATHFPVEHVAFCQPSPQRLVVCIISGGNASHT